MKRKNREVTIFSMSALDLFASALGAFILIAIVMIPHFPNIGMARQSDVDAALDRLEAKEAANEELRAIREELERALQAERAAAQRELAETQDELQRVRFPHLDLVIALDVTGSMRDEIEGVREEVDDLSGILTRLAPSVGVGIVAFGDRNWRRPITTFNLREIDGPADQTALRSFVNTLRANMGCRDGPGLPCTADPYNPDSEEAFLRSLREAMGMNWRSQAERRQIVVITDNPAYPEEVETAIAEAASFAARGRGRSVSTVFVNTGGDPSNAAVRFLNRIATAGDGQAVVAGGSMTANLLRSLL